MRYLRAILPLIITVILVYALDRPMGSIPALGKLLDPVNGALANAESTSKGLDEELKLPDLQGAVTVWFDDRLVPHIQANNDHDLYYVQGYLHAKYRLWQMDLQTRAAGGRVSEVLGEAAVNYDKEQRRKGMVYAAERSLDVMLKDERTANMLNAYRDGINHYISNLSKRDYPIEYKLMGFQPEPWTNIKSALLLKYMADDLTGDVRDIQHTYLRSLLSTDDFNKFFPDRIANSTPVIPTGTKYDPVSMQVPDAPAGDVWATLGNATIDNEIDETGKGSNNWALSGARTQSGKAILCNDPHLGLNLPSLWYEVQLQAPNINVYGVSLPGAPGVVIGFNDNISWGLTNNYRDVKDFYEIDILSANTYKFNGEDKPFEKRVEVIKVKGKPDVIDTVNYTVHGPVLMPDEHSKENLTNKPLALRWIAHNATNELLALYIVNRAKGYDDFVSGIHHFECPAQNFIYADKQGNIALWGQGQFINKWKDQGKYVMKGNDSGTLWGAYIPMQENPHVLNPTQGYLSSANQIVTDTTYPYWYNGKFVDYRAWRINQVLDTMHHAGVNDMFALQNDVYSILAAKALPVMLEYINNATVDNSEYIHELRKWNYLLDAKSVDATSWQIWWYFFHQKMWADKFANVKGGLLPSDEVTMNILLTDTANQELQKVIVESYNLAADSIGKLKNREWYVVKNTTLRHLTKLPAFSYSPMKNGGWGNTVNAVKGVHGPSWRMVVEMSDKVKAYGVYPGGQSGNPGSKYYGTSVANWEQGKYFELLFLNNDKQQNSDKIIYKWTIQPSNK